MIKPPRFPGLQTSFQAELKRRVEDYFAANNISPTGNWMLYLKTAIILCLFVTVYISLVFFNNGIIPSLLLSVLLGLGVAAIGFNIMHDGAHGSFSRHQWINDLAASSLDFMGASSFMWKMKHNVIHHTYTNIHEFDDDINVRPLLRLAPAQKRYSFHRFQHIYGIPLYGLLHIVWVTYKDFLKYFTGRIGNVPIKEMGWKDEFTFWGSKVSFLLFFVVIPVWVKGVVPYLVGFSVFSLSTGIFISVVFQLAHIVDGVEFFLPDSQSNKMENEWAIHQVKTTANFATKNKLVTWLVGGLNFQIEHHLFPKVSHVHYPDISRIVKQTCREFDLKYHEFPNTMGAVAAHIAFLKQVGNA